MSSLLCVSECVHERVLWVNLGLLPFLFRHRKITIFYSLSSPFLSVLSPARHWNRSQGNQFCILFKQCFGKKNEQRFVVFWFVRYDHVRSLLTDMLKDNVYSCSRGAEDHLKEIIQNIIFSVALAVVRPSKNICFLSSHACKCTETISNNFF
jgi:hypothetical protein